MKTVKLASTGLPRPPADQGQRARARRSATRSWKRRSWSWPARAGSAPSSAASTSRSTPGSSACLATGPRARSGSASRARPTATSRPGSTATASGSRSWSAIPARFIPGLNREGLEPAHGVPVDLDRPMAEVLRRADRGTRSRTALQADRDDRRRPRHRPREDQGTARPRRGDARVSEGPPGVLRRPRQDARRHALGLLRPDHGAGGWTATSTCSSRMADR